MPNLYQKLCQIQSQTGKISKSELNKFQNYKYFTEYQALNILKPLLKEQQLTLTFSDSSTDFTSQKIAELKAKYGADWKLSNEYKMWKGGFKEVSHE